jgi:hypothetical protein
MIGLPSTRRGDVGQRPSTMRWPFQHRIANMSRLGE